MTVLARNRLSLATAAPVPVLRAPATAAPERRRIGFLCPHNPHDRTAFYGTAHYAWQALCRQNDVDIVLLGGHRPRRLSDRVLRRAPPAFQVTRGDLAPLDGLVALVASHLLDAIDLPETLPVLHVTDATPRFLSDVYGWDIPETAVLAEARVTARADKTIYSSALMARRAVADLGLPASRTAVLPFGVNLDALPETCPKKAPLDQLNLLYVGIDWARKGGDIALAALHALRARGLDAHLTIVGAAPAHLARDADVTLTGFLNKQKARDAARLSALYRAAHLLVLPTRGDCTPMVLAEAMAHGTPVLATDTGGIADMIGGAGAGRVLPLQASGVDWANAVREMTAERTAYALLADAAFDRAGSHLNWTAWADGISGLLTQHAARRIAA